MVELSPNHDNENVSKNLLSNWQTSVVHFASESMFLSFIIVIQTPATAKAVCKEKSALLCKCNGKTDDASGLSVRPNIFVTLKFSKQF